MQSRIIVALDGMTREKALELARTLTGSVWGFKVNDLLLDCGLQIIRDLKQYGKVFADPKLHDIPNTVANGVAKLEQAGADLITVHASGGRRMLEEAVKGVTRAKVLAVTMLTSLDANDTEELYGRSPEKGVVDFATLASTVGVHGIVCSPLELTALSGLPLLKSLSKVVPGIRPSSSPGTDDQRRTLSAAEAIRLGADLLVIGRPITQAQDPLSAIESLNAETST